MGAAQRLAGRPDEAAALHRHAWHLADPPGRQLHLFGQRDDPRRRHRRHRPRCCSSSGRASASSRRAVDHAMACSLMIVLRRALAYVLNHTAWGRHVYAIGDDPRGGRAGGRPTQKVLIQVYALAGLICALRRLGDDRPLRLGLAHRPSDRLGNIQSITAVVIGGISLFGGRGSILGMFFGALIVGVVRHRPAPGRHRPAMDLLPDRRADHRRRRRRPVDQKGGRLMSTRTHPHGTRPDQALRQGHRARQLRLRPVSRRDPRRDRRQRRGQVDADQGDLGRGDPRRGRDPARRPADRTSSTPIEARAAGIETVYQTLAMSPALSIADNMFMGREIAQARASWARSSASSTAPRMEKFARDKLNELGLMTIQNINQAVETLSGGQRQGVAVARAAAFGSKVVILDEPTAALGVKESRRVLELIRDVRVARHPDHPDQPQHAACVRGRRPHPHPPAGPPALRDQAEGLHDVGRGGLHDRRQAARRRDRSRLTQSGAAFRRKSFRSPARARPAWLRGAWRERPCRRCAARPAPAQKPPAGVFLKRASSWREHALGLLFFQILPAERPPSKPRSRRRTQRGGRPAEGARCPRGRHPRATVGGTLAAGVLKRLT